MITREISHIRILVNRYTIGSRVRGHKRTGSGRAKFAPLESQPGMVSEPQPQAIPCSVDGAEFPYIALKCKQK